MLGTIYLVQTGDADLVEKATCVYTRFWNLFLFVSADVGLKSGRFSVLMEFQQRSL